MWLLSPQSIQKLCPSPLKVSNEWLSSVSHLSGLCCRTGQNKQSLNKSNHIFSFLIKLGKCLDRSDLLHKVFISDCDTSKTTQKWEMNNIVAVWSRNEKRIKRKRPTQPILNTSSHSSSYHHLCPVSQSVSQPTHFSPPSRLFQLDIKLLTLTRIASVKTHWQKQG